MKRPFRLEREDRQFDVPTYSRLAAAVDAKNQWAASNRGKWWKIVERRREMTDKGRARTVRVVIAEGVA